MGLRRQLGLRRSKRDLLIAVKNAGEYRLDFRYATDDDGVEAAASLAFPSTGGYDNYRTVSLPVTLTTGRHTLVVTQLTAKRGNGFLDLDRVDVLDASM